MVEGKGKVMKVEKAEFDSRDGQNEGHGNADVRGEGGV